jgi:hypothetical protein
MLCLVLVTEDGPVEIRRYMNKIEIMTSVGFFFISYLHIFFTISELQLICDIKNVPYGAKSAPRHWAEGSRRL